MLHIKNPIRLNVTYQPAIKTSADLRIFACIMQAVCSRYVMVLQVLGGSLRSKIRIDPSLQPAAIILPPPRIFLYKQRIY